MLVHDTPSVGSFRVGSIDKRHKLKLITEGTQSGREQGGQSGTEMQGWHRTAAQFCGCRSVESRECIWSSANRFEFSHAPLTFAARPRTDCWLSKLKAAVQALAVAIGFPFSRCETAPFATLESQRTKKTAVSVDHSRSSPQRFSHQHSR